MIPSKLKNQIQRPKKILMREEVEKIRVHTSTNLHRNSNRNLQISLSLWLSLSLEGMNRRSLKLKALKGFTYLERVGKMQGSDGWYRDPRVFAVGNLKVTESDTCVFSIKWTGEI